MGAVVEKVPMMNGKFELVRFAHRPNSWYFRYYVPSQGSQKRTYLKRSLKTKDRSLAEERGLEEYLKLRNIERDGGNVTAKTIQWLMDDWIEKSFQRVVTGEIQEVTWKSKRSLFQNSLKNYFATKGVKKITDLQPDTFDEYRFWRMTEGWKFYGGPNPGQRKPPTDGTVNSEIGLINEWYNNYLIPKGYVTRKPVIKTKVLDLDDLSANPPIPVKEWEKVWRWMDKWSNKDAKGVNRPEVHYWRMCFRHYLLTAYGSGCRPTELCGRYNKRQEVIDRGLTWEDVDIIPQTRWSERLKKEVDDDPIAVLDIRKTKTKVPREVPCRTAKYLERWKEFVLQWREDNGYPPPQGTDLVFANPKTNRPYSYRMYASAWEKIRTELQEHFSDHFTLYSTRSSYVTNILEEGVSRDDVCKLTGHSYEVMTRHYDRMKMRNRIPEVTKRMYGKKDNNPFGVRKLL